jgi:ABC-type glutathione transport system ATPase component
LNASDVPLLAVSGLKKFFRLRRKGVWVAREEVVKAVDGVDFEVRKGETLALVGESGAGKTTVALCVLGLLEPTAGTVRIGGIDLLGLRGRERRRARLQVQAVFQDPYDALDPRMTVGDLVGEPFDIHHIARKSERHGHVAELLARVGLGAELFGRLPRELSAGQRQRVGIARAIALSPSLLVLDEPFAFLDVLAQERILRLLRTLQTDMKLTYLLIAHDLSLVRAFASQVAVMYRGRLVEVAKPGILFGGPQHPYTRQLLAAMPPPLRHPPRY